MRRRSSVSARRAAETDSTSLGSAVPGEPAWNGGAGSYSIPSWIAWATFSPRSSAAGEADEAELRRVGVAHVGPKPQAGVAARLARADEEHLRVGEPPEDLVRAGEIELGEAGEEQEADARGHRPSG